jgi:hypothetical protein
MSSFIRDFPLRSGSYGDMLRVALIPDAYMGKMLQPTTHESFSANKNLSVEG